MILLKMPITSKFLATYKLSIIYEKMHVAVLSKIKCSQWLI